MADKRVYTIVINGLQESYEGVKSLREALDTLTDTVVNVNQQEEKTSSTKKESKASTDALAKATEKLTELDGEYQKELAKVNYEISQKKKETRESLKLSEAEATIEGEIGQTYREKQQYLSALNTVIRNNTAATREDYDALIQQSAALQADLKAQDEAMKIYVRNVGNYPGAVKEVVESHKSLKQELKELKTAMAEMLASGVSKTDEAYLKLAERAGQLKDAMADANQDITNFASDTRGLTNAINLASSAVNAYQLYNSALQVFGDENEEAAKSIQKMMSVMTLLNSLQTVQNNLLENGSATARLYTKAVELIKAALGLKKTAVEENIAVTEAATVAEETNTVAQEMNATASETNATSRGIATTAETTNTGAITANTTATEANTVATNSMSVAQKAGAVASKTLSVALRAIPLMAVIGLVMSLITYWQDIWNWFKKTFPVLDTLSKKFNKFGGLMNAIITGAKAVGKAIVNFMTNPFKTLADVVGKILEGDFKGAWQSAVDGIKNQFSGTGKIFMDEVYKGMAEGQEKMTRKQAEEEDKRLTHHANMITNQKNKDGTYRKEYIEAEQKMFDNRKKMYKKDSDEYNKVLEEEAKFHQQVEDAKTAATEKATKERSAAAKKAAAEAKKAADSAKKAAEEYQKQVDALLKENKKISDDAAKAETDNSKVVRKMLDDNLQKLTETSYKQVDAIIGDMSRLWAKFSELEEKAQKDEELKTWRKLRGSSKQAVKQAKEMFNIMSEEKKAFVKEWEDTFNEMSDRTADFHSIELAIQEYAQKRKEILMSSLAEEAQALKDKRKEEIDGIKKNIEKTKELLKTASGDNKKNLENDLKELGKNLETMTKLAQDELGKYWTEEIKIPVDFDLDKIKKNFEKVRKTLYKGISGPVEFNTISDAIIGVDGALEKVYQTAKKMNTEELQKYYLLLSDTLGLTTEQATKLYEILESHKEEKPFSEVSEDLEKLFTKAEIRLNKFGTAAYDVQKKVDELGKEYITTLEKQLSQLDSEQDKIISRHEKIIKRFQDAVKDIKFEPVMEDDALSKWFDGQILNMDKTKKRYDELLVRYRAYQAALKEGSEERIAYEKAWQKKLMVSQTKQHEALTNYGVDSKEYRQAWENYEQLLYEKKKADDAYKLEYEKVTQQIEEIDKKSNRIREDYYQSLHDRMSEIYSSFNENLFQPLAEGFGALLEFQLEEAKEALENVTALYDKAVEAREESAERMKQINDELRADDGQNKEALQQRLAEEEVLLVQREEQERALQKEKEKREKEVEKKEKQQRKMELGQKLIEGIVNTALGVTAALKWGFPLGPVFAAVVGAMGALQTALIAKQISKLEKGGKVGEKGVSRSHKQGGHRIEDTNIEVEGGEWVINKKSSQKYDTVLRAINEDNVNLVNKQIEIIKEKRVTRENVVRKFASGGQINTLTATKAVKENNQIEAITDLIRQIDFQPTVAVTDINKVNKNLVRVQQYAGKSA